MKKLHSTLLAFAAMALINCGEATQSNQGTTGTTSTSSSTTTEWTQLTVGYTDCMSSERTVISNDGSLDYLDYPEEAMTVCGWAGALSSDQIQNITSLLESNDFDSLEEGFGCDPYIYIVFEDESEVRYLFDSASELETSAPGVFTLLETIDDYVEDTRPQDGSDCYEVD